MKPTRVPGTEKGGKPSRNKALSDYYLLTQSFLFIIKRLQRETLVELARQLEGRLIDVGCGSSPYRPLFTNISDYVGIDLEESRRSTAVGDADRLPVATGCASSVFCAEVLEHTADPAAVLAEIDRVLQPGGRILVTAPMCWNLHYQPHDYRRFTKYRLQQLLEGHGFRVLSMHRIGGLFSLVGSRLVESVSTELFHRLSWIPIRVRHALILCYLIPMSLLFFGLARLADGFEETDAIGSAVLGEKIGARDFA